MRGLRELNDLCNVITKEFEKHNQIEDTCRRFTASVSVIELYQKATEAEKAIINTVFLSLIGKSFSALIQDFLEGFKGQQRLYDLITRTIDLADELKSAGWD